MALSSCFSLPHFSFTIQCSERILRSRRPLQEGAQNHCFSLKTQLFGEPFLGASRVALRPKLAYPKRSPVIASWLTNPQIASSVFTLGTVAVLPFYALMVVAPKTDLTRKSMESNMPYVVLGLLYAYLLFFSWTPNTIRLIFASKYWLPELPGMAKMFSSEMTLASAWIHLLTADLFAARQVYKDGLENEIETRHSVSFCLLFSPIGILTHVITKALTKSAGSTRHGI